MSIASAAWRIAVLTIAFVFLYMFFGYYVAWQNPAVRSYYSGPDWPTFYASLKGNWQNSPWIFAVATRRALLYVAFMFPLIRMLRVARWESATAAALFLSAWTTILLLPNPLMPASVARSHFWETSRIQPGLRNSSRLALKHAAIGCQKFRDRRPLTLLSAAHLAIDCFRFIALVTAVPAAPKRHMSEQNQHFRDELPPMLRLAAPLVLAELSWMAMAFVDTIMVGRLPNSAVAIGAVSLASVTFYAVAILGSGTLLGLDTLVSQAFGALQIDECHAALLDGMYISLALTPLLMGVLEFGCVPLWRYIGIDPAILRESIPYLNTLNWSLLPLFVYFGARRYLQGMNLVKPVMFAMVTANLVNLLGNWMFIYGHLGAPRMGIVGSGWSTCVARIYMAVVLLAYIAYHDSRYKTGLRHIRLQPHFQRIKELLRLGLPAGLQMTLEVGVFAAATALVAKLDPVSLAAHQIALNMASITYMVPLGISSAAAVRVGQAIGRRDARGASHAGWSAIAIGSAFMTCAALAFLLVPRLYRSNLHARSSRDSHGGFSSGRRCCFPIVRWLASGGYGRPARCGRNARPHDHQSHLLLVSGPSRRRLSLLSIALGGGRNVGRALRRAGFDWFHPALGVVPQSARTREIDSLKSIAPLKFALASRA